MKDETINVVMEAVDELLFGAGIPSIEDFGSRIQQFAEALQNMTQFLTREQVIDFLRKVEMPPQEELNLAGAAQNFPAILIGLLGHILPILEEQYPLITAGRPPALSSEEQRNVCEYI